MCAANRENIFSYLNNAGIYPNVWTDFLNRQVSVGWYSSFGFLLYSRIESSHNNIYRAARAEKPPVRGNLLP